MATNDPYDPYYDPYADPYETTPTTTPTPEPDPNEPDPADSALPPLLEQKLVGTYEVADVPITQLIETFAQDATYRDLTATFNPKIYNKDLDLPDYVVQYRTNNKVNLENIRPGTYYSVTLETTAQNDKGKGTIIRRYSSVAGATKAVYNRYHPDNRVQNSYNIMSIFVPRMYGTEALTNFNLRLRTKFKYTKEYLKYYDINSQFKNIIFNDTNRSLENFISIYLYTDSINIYADTGAKCEFSLSAHDNIITGNTWEDVYSLIRIRSLGLYWGTEDPNVPDTLIRIFNEYTDFDVNNVNNSIDNVLFKEFTLAHSPEYEGKSIYIKAIVEFDHGEAQSVELTVVSNPIRLSLATKPVYSTKSVPVYDVNYHTGDIEIKRNTIDGKITIVNAKVPMAPVVGYTYFFFNDTNVTTTSFVGLIDVYKTIKPDTLYIDDTELTLNKTFTSVVPFTLEQFASIKRVTIKPWNGPVQPCGVINDPTIVDCGPNIVDSVAWKDLVPVFTGDTNVIPNIDNLVITPTAIPQLASVRLDLTADVSNMKSDETYIVTWYYKTTNDYNWKIFGDIKNSITTANTSVSTVGYVNTINVTNIEFKAMIESSSDYTLSDETFNDDIVVQLPTTTLSTTSTTTTTTTTSTATTPSTTPMSTLTDAPIPLQHWYNNVFDIVPTGPNASGWYTPGGSHKSNEGFVIVNCDGIVTRSPLLQLSMEFDQLEINSIYIVEWVISSGYIAGDGAGYKVLKRSTTETTFTNIKSTVTLNYQVPAHATLVSLNISEIGVTCTVSLKGRTITGANYPKDTHMYLVNGVYVTPPAFSSFLIPFNNPVTC